MARSQLILVGGLLALPLVGLAVLLSAPDTDVHWEHHPSHFWLVLVTAALNAVLAYATGVAARRRGDRRVHLVSLSFLAASGFLALHALATPGVLLDKPNLGFVIATPVGLVLAGIFAVLSAIDSEPIQPKYLERALLVLLGVWAVVCLAFFPEVDDSVVPERGSPPMVGLSIVGVACYAYAVVRYLDLYRQRRSRLVLGFTVAFVLLAEAMVAVALGRNWQASWWEWHLLMLLAFAVIAVMAHQEGSEERFGRLYLDRDAQPVTVLFADLMGFTAFSERHAPADVSRMLDTLFGVAIPAIERHGGRVDRLIGDAVFATFEADNHAERAARAALALQDETGALAAEHPDWPRFRAGLNTGDAAVGVLGTGTGRTYSAIGDTVNLGSRIEGLAPAGAVAISAETAKALWGARTEPLATVQVKGREEPVEVLLLLGLPPG
jgi:class 3 adenylate cyclase